MIGFNGVKQLTAYELSTKVFDLSQSLRDADHCLIDEAMTPLLLAAPAENISAYESTAHQCAAALAKQLKRGEDSIC